MPSVLREIFGLKIYHKMQASCRTPDEVEERFLTNPNVSHNDDRLDFLVDEIECVNPLIPNFRSRSLTECNFGEAVNELTNSSLVIYSSVNKALSVHLLVQAAIVNRLPNIQIQSSPYILASLFYPMIFRIPGNESGHTKTMAGPHGRHAASFYRRM